MVEETLLPHPRREEFAEYLQDIAVSYPLGYQVNDQLVRDIVEEALDIGVYDPSVAILIEFQDTFDGLMSVPPGRKPKESSENVGSKVGSRRERITS